MPDKWENYVQYTIISIETDNIGMGRKQVIQVILYIVQTNYQCEAENNLYYLIRENRGRKEIFAK